MIGKHAPTVHVLSILLLAVGSVITYTEVTTGTQASPSAVRAAQTASLPLFLPAVSYDPGGSGQAGDFRTVAVADVNADDRPDVAVTNFWTHTVGVLLANGDGTFRPAVTYSPGGANPTAIAIADVSGDGHPDLVVGIWSGGIAVLLGDGDGTFQPAVRYATGGVQVSDVIVADVNLDAKPDLIVANFGSVVGTLLGNGNGTFRPVVVQSAAYLPSAWRSLTLMATPSRTWWLRVGPPVVWAFCWATAMADSGPVPPTTGAAPLHSPSRLPI